MPNYFLAKTDPDTFSIDDFVREKVTTWDGVHSYQAINCIKEWQIGDLVYIYHSLGEASIVGLATVITEPKKDENDARGISWIANLELIETYPKETRINLKTIKETGLFADFALARQSRLSVMRCPVPFVDWLQPKLTKISFVTSI